MSRNTINLDAETGANYIGDDANPAITITNSSTGAAIQTNSLVVTSNATITADKLTVNTPILAGNATITGLHLRGASVASGALLGFEGNALVSVTTIKFITGGVNGTKAIRIVQADGTFAWIPVLPDGAVTGAAV